MADVGFLLMKEPKDIYVFVLKSMAVYQNSCAHSYCYTIIIITIMPISVGAKLRYMGYFASLLHPPGRKSW